MRKWVVLYHVDNFNVRLHKLVDNLYRLIDLSQDGVDIPAYPILGEVRRKLDDFKQIACVRSALDDRKRFVHHYRELPAGKAWGLFAPAVRLESIADADAELIRYEMDTGPIEAFALRKVEEVREILGLVGDLRNSCFESLASAVTRRASELPSRRGHTVVQGLQVSLESLKEVRERN